MNYGNGQPIQVGDVIEDHRHRGEIWMRKDGVLMVKWCPLSTLEDNRERDSFSYRVSDYGNRWWSDNFHQPISSAPQKPDPYDYIGW